MRKSDEDCGGAGRVDSATWAALFLQMEQYLGRAPVVTLSRGGAPSHRDGLSPIQMPSGALTVGVRL